MSNVIFLPIPEDFNFANTVHSHGWSDLAPFEVKGNAEALSCVFSDLGDADPVLVNIIPDGERLKIEAFGDSVSEEKILADVGHILRLDDDLSGFYSLIAEKTGLDWVLKAKAGRLLRSPTVFEDLVKTLCTTNCSWGMTKKMVTNLVLKLGEPTVEGQRAFPTPETLAGFSADFFREEIRAGYRSPYFVDLAESVASGKVNPEEWLNSELPTAELKKEMKKVKGVGDYAAENLLKLVGRYDGLALDSWLRAGFYKKHNQEKICSDKKIERFYRKFGTWRGLAMWCDMTEKWFD